MSRNQTGSASLDSGPWTSNWNASPFAGTSHQTRIAGNELVLARQNKRSAPHGSTPPNASTCSARNDRLFLAGNPL
jgi:hypothetical protein